MTNLLTKRVTMIELFYDLVFVYMISRATGLIHHLNQGIVNLSTFLIFTVVIIIFINSWMVQTVYINRYGRSSWSDITFSFIDMMIVLYLSNSFNDWHNHQNFFLGASLLSLTLCLQYVLIYFKNPQKTDRQIAIIFAGILGFRTVTLFIGGVIPTTSGISIALVGVITSWIAPSFTGQYTQKHPIIFSHLLERLTLLIIITFGETIVGIASYFTPQSLSIWSVFIFTLVASLFFTYITEFDHLIEEKQPHETGNWLIYLHYPILFGISLMTVALHFIGDSTANKHFTAICLYAGLFLFYSGILCANRYNQTNFRFSKQLFWLMPILTISGLYLSILNPTMPILILTSTSLTMLITGLIVHSLIYQSKPNKQ